MIDLGKKAISQILSFFLPNIGADHIVKHLIMVKFQLRHRSWKLWVIISGANYYLKKAINIKCFESCRRIVAQGIF